jgi:myosin-7
MFGFLPSENGFDSSTLTNGRLADARRQQTTELDSQLFNNMEDLSGFQFGKFAATYFLGQATATHIRKPLRQPLIAHDDSGNQIVRKFRVASRKMVVGQD